MVELISVGGVAGAAVLFFIGIVDLVIFWKPTDTAKAAVEAATTQAQDASRRAAEIASPDKTVEEKQALKEYAGLDLSGNWEALAKLATALKDLDRSSRLFVLSLAFLAVSGATVGLDSIGSGLAG